MPLSFSYELGNKLPNLVGTKNHDVIFYHNGQYLEFSLFYGQFTIRRQINSRKYFLRRKTLSKGFLLVSDSEVYPIWCITNLLPEKYLYFSLFLFYRLYFSA